MFGPTEAKLLEAFFWLVAIALFVHPLLPGSAPLQGWRDHAVWLADSALAVTAGLFFTFMRIRPGKLPRKLNLALFVLSVVLLGLQAFRY